MLTKGQVVLKKKLLYIGGALSVVVFIAAVGGYFYWRHLKTTPQYSLALLVEAAKTNDQATIDEVVNVDAVVDDFAPQVIERAAELYGRGLPRGVVDRLMRLTDALKPAVKQRARAELPGLIRRQTERYANVPFVGFVIGADRYLNIVVNGDEALVTSKLPRHTFEVKMRRAGDKWQIVGVKDSELAKEVAQSIGQELMAFAAGDNIEEAARSLGISDLSDLLEKAAEAAKTK